MRSRVCPAFFGRAPRCTALRVLGTPCSQGEGLLLHAILCSAPSFGTPVRVAKGHRLPQVSSRQVCIAAHPDMSG
jgi:hypothetical protein